MGFGADEPRALPWAGMSDALGVSHLSRLPPVASPTLHFRSTLVRYCSRRTLSCARADKNVRAPITQGGGFGKI